MVGLYTYITMPGFCDTIVSSGLDSIELYKLWWNWHVTYNVSTSRGTEQLNENLIKIKDK